MNAVLRHRLPVKLGSAAAKPCTSPAGLAGEGSPGGRGRRLVGAAGQQRGRGLSMISYCHDDGPWLDAAEGHALVLAAPFIRPMDAEMTPCTALEESWI